MKDTKAESDSRREFLKTGVTLGAGAAAASLLPESVAAVEDADTESEQKRKPGYQLTQHVVDYYKTTTI